MNISTQTNDSILSANGRFGRLAFAAWSFLSTLVTCIVLFVLAFIGSLFTGSENNLETGNFPFLIIALFFISYVILIYFSFVFAIRRFHDRNQTGWLSLLILVPLVNFFVMLYLFCAKGTEGPNKFGSVHATAGWEKVLGWIYIVIIPLAVIFALVGSAVPAYQEYVQRSQQAQIEQQINQAK